MPSLTLPDRLIWFAHCPKAGGTSVEQFMVARWGDRVGHLHWGWDRWWRHGGWRVADLPNSPQHMIWRDATTRLPRPPDAVFALVRDPVARLVSEYRWQQSGRCRTGLGKLLAFLPFSVWLRVMLAVVRHAPYAFDNHVRPQTDFIPDTAHVFRLEDGLERALHWLVDAAGESRTAIDVPHAIPTRSGPRITARDRALIAEVYAEDYARFGYRPDETPPRAEPTGRLTTLFALAIAHLDRRGWL